jgi:hypothetical protein
MASDVCKMIDKIDAGKYPIDALHSMDVVKKSFVEARDSLNIAINKIQKKERGW